MQAAEVKALQAVFLSCLGCPWFTAVQERAEDACLVHLELGVGSQLVVGPHPLAQSWHYTGSFYNVFVDLTVKRQVAGDDRAKVSEVVSNLKHLVVNSERGGRWNVLNPWLLSSWCWWSGQTPYRYEKTGWSAVGALPLCLWSVRHHQQKVAPWWGLRGLWSWPSAVPGLTACHHFWCVGECLLWSVWNHGSTEVKKMPKIIGARTHPFLTPLCIVKG